MSFRLVPKWMTLNDLERRNSPYFALFHRIRVLHACGRKKSSRSLSHLLMSFLPAQAFQGPLSDVQNSKLIPHCLVAETRHCYRPRLIENSNIC